MNKTYRITLAGFGGQGIMMMGQMLAYAGNEENKNSLWFPSYGPETRGGTANCAVIISENPINSPVFSKADTLIAMNKPSLVKFAPKVANGGAILYNSSLISECDSYEGISVYGIPVNELAQEIGNPKVANMVMLGAYLELTGLFSEAVMETILKKFLGEAKTSLLGVNIEAMKAGRAIMKDLVK